MKRTVKTAAVVLMLAAMLALNASALESNIDQYAGDSGETREIYEALGDEAKELLRQLGVEEGGFSELYSINSKKVIDVLLEVLTKGISSKLSLLTAVTGALLIAFAASLLTEKNSRSPASPLSYLFVCLCAAPGFVTLFSSAASVIDTAAAFVKVFVPVYAAVIAGAGNPSLALSYGGAVLGFAGALTLASGSVFIPLFAVMGAVSFAGGLSDAVDSARLTASLKKWLSVAMGLCSTMFTGILVVKNALAKSADGLAVRGVRFLIGSGVPVVGGAVSEAFQTALASLAVVRSTVGVLGIVCLAVLFIPIAAELVSWLVLLGAASLIAGMLGCERESTLFKNLSCCVSLMLSLVVLTAAVLIITAGAVLR